jgi:C-terminal processing protease CtpA/Prc
LSTVYTKKEGIAEQAGIEIGDIIIAINNRPVKEITLEEQRKGLGLKGETVYTVKKQDGKTISYTLFIDKQII